MLCRFKFQNILQIIFEMTNTSVSGAIKLIWNIAGLRYSIWRKAYTYIIIVERKHLFKLFYYNQYSGTLIMYTTHNQNMFSSRKETIIA